MAGVHTFPDGTEVWQDDYWEAFEETGSQEGAINLLKQYGADEGGALGLGTGNMGLQRYRTGQNASPLMSPSTASASQSTGVNSEEAYQLLLKYAPQLAQMDFASQQKYLPQMAQLALDMKNEFGGQQLQADLSQAKEFQPQFQSLAERLRSSDRGSSMQDVISQMPALQQIQREQLSPEDAKMRAMLQSQIQEDLGYGEMLTPEQARAAEQSARTADISRGIGSGGGSSNREAVRKSLEGRRIKGERQGAASAFLAQSAAERIDPIMAVTGQPSSALTTGSQAVSSPTQTPQTAGTTPQGISSAFNTIGLGNQFAQQDLSQDQYDLSKQLATTLAQQYGWNV